MRTHLLLSSHLRLAAIDNGALPISEFKNQLGGQGVAGTATFFFP